MSVTEDGSIAEQCHEALKDVTDPELPISVIDLGLIYEIDVEDGHVDIDMSLTAMGCPAAGLMKDEVRERLVEIEGVETVSVEIVWDPVWTKDKMTDKGKQELRSLGIAV